METLKELKENPIFLPQEVYQSLLERDIAAFQDAVRKYSEKWQKEIRPLNGNRLKMYFYVFLKCL